MDYYIVFAHTGISLPIRVSVHCAVQELSSTVVTVLQVVLLYLPREPPHRPTQRNNSSHIFHSFAPFWATVFITMSSPISRNVLHDWQDSVNSARLSVVTFVPVPCLLYHR